MKKVTVEELLEKAAQPAKDAPRLHKFYKGKMGVALKCRVRDFNDFAIWYTPGVAAVCKEIQADKQKAYEYTNKWNSVAVISDGTRVLGLGDIGPEAGLPVMEGKGILYKYLGGVDAFPICLDERIRINSSTSAKLFSRPSGDSISRTLPSLNVSRSWTPCAKPAKSRSGMMTSRARLA